MVFFGNVHELATYQRAAFALFDKLGIASEQLEKRERARFILNRLSGLDKCWAGLAACFIGIREENFSLFEKQVQCEREDMSPEATEFANIFYEASKKGFQYISELAESCQTANGRTYEAPAHYLQKR